MTESQAKTLAVTLTIIGCILFGCGLSSCANTFTSYRTSGTIDEPGTIFVVIGILSIGLGRFVYSSRVLFVLVLVFICLAVGLVLEETLQWL